MYTKSNDTQAPTRTLPHRYTKSNDTQAPTRTLPHQGQAVDIT